MQLLTVTCWRDMPLLSLQLESISKFLNGKFKHYIVICDNPQFNTRKYIKRYYRTVKNYYKNQINFEIIIPDTDLKWKRCQSGWQKQQIYKFYYYDKIKDDYLILDSKNFFVRTCNIDDFSHFIGSNHVRSIKGGVFDDINSVYSRYFNTAPIEFPLATCTPFKIEYQILANFKLPKDIAESLINLESEIRPFSSEKGAWPSEFLFYSYLVKDRIKSLPIISSFPVLWDRDDNTTKFLNIIKKDYRIKLTGLHNRALNKFYESGEIDIINEFLKQFDLSFTF